MQVCLSTSTMPSARRKDAPVGHTSTQGGCLQCWHISGSEVLAPLCRSRTVTLRIHCASVAGPWRASSPCSSLQARTQASQPDAHLPVSMSMPQRCALLAGSFAGRATARSMRRTPGASASAAAAAPTRPRNWRRAWRPFCSLAPGSPLMGWHSPQSGEIPIAATPQMTRWMFLRSRREDAPKPPRLRCRG